MQMTSLSERKEKDQFAERAARYLKENPEKYSYTDGEIKQGEYFGIRFGMGNDCVVVFLIGDEVLNYQQILDEV